MGKKPDRLTRAEAPGSPRTVKSLESEIERSRRRLDAYVDELDRRRHRLVSLSRHPWPAAAGALGAVALVAGAVVLNRRRSRRIHRSRRKARNFREALLRMTEHPERVASDSKSPWSRVLVAVAPVVVKMLADAARRRRR